VPVCLVRYGFGFATAERELTGGERLAASAAGLAADLCRQPNRGGRVQC
jgi:ribosomal protein L13E